MATRRSWLTTIVLVIIAIHLTVLQVEGGGGGGGGKDKKDKKNDCYSYDDCCNYYNPCCDHCCEPYYDNCYSHYNYGGKKGHCGKQCHDRCCDNYRCDNYDCNDRCDKKDGKKDGKSWNKMMKRGKKNKDKGKDKGKDNCDNNSCCDDCCGGQTVIVKNGPAIIQTIIVDKDVYSKYCKGCYSHNNPLQKVCIEDNCECYRSRPKYSPCDNFDPQSFRVAVQDPCCRRTCDPCGYY